MIIAFLALLPFQTPAAEPAHPFIVPAGFDVRLFSSEAMTKPVAMTWDARGRLWIIDAHEPRYIGDNTKDRADRIRILEDIDADGTSDRATVFADGFNDATAILLGNGGVYLAEGSRVLFLEDKDGDDKPDHRTEIPTNLGDQGATLSNFTWGPDGKLYMVYNLPQQRKGDASLPAGGIARIDPRSRKFERFAEGLSGVCGLDFDGAGNAFVSTSTRLAHVLPGGIYSRLEPSAPANVLLEYNRNVGLSIYQGDQWPPEWRGTVLHAKRNGIHTGHFAPNGSGFVFTNLNTNQALLADRFIHFTPAAIQSGPDGAVWFTSWELTMHRRAQQLSRIWRMVWTGDDSARAVPSRPSREMNLAQLSSDDLAALITHSNIWHRRMAQRLLSERGLTTFGRPHLHQNTPLHKHLKPDNKTDVRLAALWTLHGAGFVEEVTLYELSKDKDPDIRRCTARLTGERGYLLKDSFDNLTRLAKDSDPSVRIAAAIAARQFVSGDLTTNTPPKIPIREVATGGILSALFLNSSNNVDETFEFHFWMALEPIIAFDPNVIDYYHGDGARRQWPFSANVLRRITHRIGEMRDEPILSRSIIELGKIPAEAGPALVAGLQGFLDGHHTSPTPNREAIAAITNLIQSKDPEISQAAGRVLSLWKTSSQF